MLLLSSFCFGFCYPLGSHKALVFTARYISFLARVARQEIREACSQGRSRIWLAVADELKHWQKKETGIIFPYATLSLAPVSFLITKPPEGKEESEAAGFHPCCLENVHGVGQMQSDDPDGNGVDVSVQSSKGLSQTIISQTVALVSLSDKCSSGHKKKLWLEKSN